MNKAVKLLLLMCFFLCLLSGGATYLHFSCEEKELFDWSSFKCINNETSSETTTTPETPEATTPETSETTTPETPEATTPETSETTTPETSETTTPETPEATTIPTGVCTIDNPDPNSLSYTYNTQGECVLSECTDNYQVVEDSCKLKLWNECDIDNDCISSAEGKDVYCLKSNKDRSRGRCLTKGGCKWAAWKDDTQSEQRCNE